MKKFKILFGVSPFCALLCLLAVIVGCGGFGENIEAENDLPIYTVRFDSQFGSYAEAISETAGNVIVLPVSTRDAYTFKGWYGEETDGASYGGAGDDYTVVGDVTMYAQWEKIITELDYYTITFDSQGGEAVEPITEMAGTIIKLPASLRDGYTFKGWYGEETDGDFYGGAGDDYTVVGDVTMYAQWILGDVTLYTITFDSQGGADVMSIREAYGTTITLPASLRDGYTFKGWYDEKTDGALYGIEGGSYKVIGDVTMYAQWEEIITEPDYYTITFDSQGGEAVEPIRKTAETIIKLPASLRYGYMFKGWYSEETDGILYGVAEDDYTVIGDVTMYARWEEIIPGTDYYTITFYSMDGIVVEPIVEEVKPITEAYGTTVKLPGYVRDGYTFKGWYSEKSGGVLYGIEGGSYKIMGDVTMYAQWVLGDVVLYTIFFDSQGGTEVAPIRAAAGEIVRFPNSPTRDGYAFSGWVLKSELGHEVYFGDGFLDSEIPVNPYFFDKFNSAYFYAAWEPDYTVTFDSQGGSSVSPIKIYGSMNPNIKLPFTIRSGYAFDGWYSASSGGTRYGGIGSDYMVRDNLTMYAQWTLSDLGANGNGNDGETKTINGIECVLVKAGTFTQGVGGSTIREVTLTQDYWIGKYEITQAQYRSVMGHRPSYFVGDNRPVERVTWNNAYDFCEKVGGRLPTEAEWEFAARGGNRSRDYIYSGSDNLDDVAWHSNNIPSQTTSDPRYGTQPVGQKQANELGIYDMSGNVYEWCNDRYDSYSTSAVTNPKGPDTGSRRVVRGGSWVTETNVMFRVSTRGSVTQDDQNEYVGFRVVFPRD